MNHPSFEVVQFTTASTGDYYLCKKLSHVDAAFACQSTTDAKEIQVSWTRQSNGVTKITLTLTSGTNAVTGYLTIIGRL